MQFNLKTLLQIQKMHKISSCEICAIEIMVSDIHHHVLEINIQPQMWCCRFTPEAGSTPFATIFQGFLLLFLGSVRQNVEDIVGRNLVRSRLITHTHTYAINYIVFKCFDRYRVASIDPR